MWHLHWQFRNDHKWSKSFDNEDDMFYFVNICGLVSHHDVVEVFYQEDGSDKFYLKGSV